MNKTYARPLMQTARKSRIISEQNKLELDTRLAMIKRACEQKQHAEEYSDYDHVLELVHYRLQYD